MPQPNFENHFHLNNAKCELEIVDYNAIQEQGPENRISQKLRAMRREIESIEALVIETGLDPKV